MGEDEHTVEQTPNETWLDHAHTSAQIMSIIITCLIIFLAFSIAGTESGMVVGTLVIAGWFFVAIAWWVVYRLIGYVLFNNPKPPPE